MPDIYGNMSPEEERMLLQYQQAQAMRAGQGRPVMSPDTQMSPAGMVNQSAMTPEQRAALQSRANYNPETKEAQYAALLRGGQDAVMNTGAAKGKTIGDIYVAPTWSEIAANAVKQGVGGYQMRQGRQGLDKAAAGRRDAEEAQGSIDAEDFRVAKEQQDTENTRAGRRLDQDDATQALATSKFENTIAQQEAAATAAAIAEATRQAERIEDMDIDAAAAIEASRIADEELAIKKLNALNSSDKKGKQTATEKTAEYRAATFKDGLDAMTGIIKAGYDPTDTGGFIDKLTNEFDVTRFMSSEAGQKFQSAASTVREAALRTATGAAAPEGEKRDYVKALIPAPGDTPETVKFKMNKLNQFGQALGKLGGETPEEAKANWLTVVDGLQAADKAEQEAGGDMAYEDPEKERKYREWKAARGG